MVRCLKQLVKASLSVAFVLLVLAVPNGPSSVARADLDGVCVMYCDDGGYTDDGGYSGGGGCATADYTDDSSYYNGPSYVGEPHPQYANVVYDGQYWQPETGYEWANDDPNDYTVRRIVGSYHPDHPNVVWDGEYWVPAEGYAWVSRNSSDDYRVIRSSDYGALHPDYPNVVWSGDGWVPADGFKWASEADDDFSVVRTIGSANPDQPNVVWGGDGWEPASGYTWLSDDETDLRVIGEGMSHPDYPNTRWTGENWKPAEGYVWLTEDPDDLRVVPAPEPVAEVEPAAVQQTETESIPVQDASSDLTPTGDSEGASEQLAMLREVETPPSTGFSSSADRQAQLKAMTNAQIDTELDRIRSILVRMQKDFEKGSNELQSWLIESQQAENEAIMAAFNAMLGGSLKNWETSWKAYPKLKLIAENGLRYLGLEKPVSTVMDATATEQAKTDAEQELARAYMLELYEQLKNFDDELISDGGPPAAAFASFIVDYGYQVGRWALARQQINIINENLDKPNGTLEAQKAISKLQEELIAERKRRQSATVQ